MKSSLLVVLSIIVNLLYAGVCHAQAQFTGQYNGGLYVSISGPVNTPEYGGRTGAAIDNAGNFVLFGGKITGVVDNSGAITFDPNDFSFTTGTVAGGKIAAVSTVTQPTGAVVTTRLDMELSTGVAPSGPVGEFFLDEKRSLPALPPETANAITFGDGKFVQVARNGVIYVSSDGLSWEAPVTPTTQKLNDIAYGDGRFVAVGDGGTILHSTDAQTWVLTTYPRSPFAPAANIHGVAFGNGVFAAAGLSNLTLQSADGVAWNVVGTADAYNSWSGLDFANGRFFYMGNRLGVLAARFMTSTDGLTFTPVQQATPNKVLLHLSYANGVYIAAGGAGNGGGMRFTSNDGSGAVEVSTPSTISSVTTDGSRFIASGYSSDFTSTDGLAWTVVPGSKGKGTDAAYGNGRVVFADTFRTSTDLVNWTGEAPKTLPAASYLKDIVSANGMFVGVGPNGSVVSYDGLVWEGNTATNNLKTLTAGGDGFYALGGTTVIVKSGDGLNWEQVATFSSQLNDIAYGDDGVVAVGDGNFLVRSTDGRNWTQVFPRESGKPNYGKVLYGNGTWLAFQLNGKHRRSTDGGRTWTPEETSPQGVSDVEFYDGQFVALGRNSSVLTSMDGITWSVARPQTTTSSTYTFIDRAGGKWIIGGVGQPLSSSDLINWTVENDRFQRNYVAVASVGPNVVFLADQAGEIFHSRLVSNILPLAAISPADPVVAVGGQLNLNGSFIGSNLTYQWFRTGVPLRNDGRISGADTPNLTITGLSGFDAGKYTLRATSGANEAFTVPAKVVLPDLAKITKQPVTIDTYPGFTETLAIEATATASAPITAYQWRKDGVAIPGAGSATLQLTNISAADVASYDCAVTTAGGTVISRAATLNLSLEFPANVITENPSAPARVRKADDATRIDLNNGFYIRYNSGWKRYSSTTNQWDRDWVAPISGFGGNNYKLPGGNIVLMRDKFPNVSPLQESGYSVMRPDGSAAEFYPMLKNGSPQNILPKLLFTRNYVWIAGDFDTIAGHTTHRLARLNPDGTVDTTFSLTDTSLAVPTWIWDDTDGGILLGVPNPTRPALHKAYADGSPDTAFFQVSRGANLSWNLNGLAIAKNGDLLIVGELFYFNNSYGKGFYRFTRSGAFSSLPLTQYDLNSINFQQLDDGRMVLIAKPAGNNIYRAYQLSETGGSKVIRTYPYNSPINYELTPIPLQPHNTAGIFGTNTVELTGVGSAATLTIVSQPQDQVILAGQPVTLSVAATGTFPMTYQWRRNGVNIAGATGPILPLGFSEFANLGGNYTVVVTDASGTVTSRAAVVTDLGGGARSNIVVRDGFEDWALQNSIPVNEAGANDDPDKDGVPNLLEYITGSNPTGSSTISTPVSFVTVGAESYQTISIVRRKNLTGVTMGAESSTDMFRTAPVPAIEHGMPEDLGDGFERITYRSTVPVSASPRGFIRITASTN
ncbi:hypothetical protein ACFSSA_12910 [Luteolibacter algae]|uniref:Ig-like domain-containing protein n=1 Tax=Luteolibacter algae TaxID=454151 RepID=A0ABW5DA16_9BACT